MRQSPMRTLVVGVVLILANTLLCACGTKGALTLPSASGEAGASPAGGNLNTQPFPSGTVIR